MSIDAPTLKVEIRFAAGPDWGAFALGSAVIGVSGLGPGAAYVDVSSYVRLCNITRGKQRELEEFRAGFAEVVLDNRTRIFDPLNTAGTYYGQIKPGRMIRISATHPTTSKETIIYKGVIREWDLGYNPGNSSGDATATIKASDILYDIQNQDVTVTTTAGLAGVPILEILTEAGITDRSIDAGQHSMQAITLANSNALTAMQNVAYSEGVDVSTIYANKTNQVIFEDYISLETKPNNGTFGTAALPVHRLDITYESNLIKNNVTFTRTGGSAQNKTDATSIADYGTRSLTRASLDNSTDSDVGNLAQVAIDQFKDAEVRIREISLEPRANAALMTQCLDRELRDLITVEFSPPGGGSAISQDHFIIGLRHRFTPQKYQCTFVLNSTTGKVGLTWILGTTAFPVQIGF